MLCRGEHIYSMNLNTAIMLPSLYVAGYSNSFFLVRTASCHAWQSARYLMASATIPSTEHKTLTQFWTNVEQSSQVTDWLSCITPLCLLWWFVHIPLSVSVHVTCIMCIVAPSGAELELTENHTAVPFFLKNLFHACTESLQKSNIFSYRQLFISGHPSDRTPWRTIYLSMAWSQTR